MARIDIEDLKENHLKATYRHLSVQSLLDIKAVNGYVDEKILTTMYSNSSMAKTVMFDGKVAYILFVMPTDEKECSIFVISTTLGYSDKESLEKSFEALIKDLPNYNFYSIVYKGNHCYSKLLKSNGFKFVKEIIHGVEQRQFLLLEREQDG